MTRRIGMAFLIIAPQRACSFNMLPKKHTAAIAVIAPWPLPARTTISEHAATARTIQSNVEVPRKEHVPAPVATPVSRRPAEVLKTEHSAAPVFESLPHGAEARAHAERGAFSRSAAIPGKGDKGPDDKHR